MTTAWQQRGAEHEAAAEAEAEAEAVADTDADEQTASYAEADSETAAGRQAYVQAERGRKMSPCLNHRPLLLLLRTGSNSLLACPGLQKSD